MPATNIPPSCEAHLWYDRNRECPTCRELRKSGHGFSQEDIWHEMRHLGCDEAQAIRSLREAEARLDD